MPPCNAVTSESLPARMCGASPLWTPLLPLRGCRRRGAPPRRRGSLRVALVVGGLLVALGSILLLVLFSIRAFPEVEDDIVIALGHHGKVLG